MVIGVTDHPFELNLLLYIRHAWQLAGEVDLPELVVAPEGGTSQAPDTASPLEWEKRWYAAWERVWQWYRNEHLATAPELATAEELLRWRNTLHSVRRPGQSPHPAAPPLWTADYGWDGIDLAAFTAWDGSLAVRPPRDAERPQLAHLVPAWEAGLDTILVLPYAGYFATRPTPRHLAVSPATRNDPAAYSQALQLRWPS